MLLHYFRLESERKTTSLKVPTVDKSDKIIGKKRGRAKKVNSNKKVEPETVIKIPRKKHQAVVKRNNGEPRR